MSKPLQKSKTFWVNLAVVVIAGLTGMMGTDVIAANPELLAYMTAGVGAINIVLRLLTDSPVSVGK